MVIEKLRQNFKREAAEEAARENARKNTRAGERARGGFTLSPKVIINHPRFGRIVTIWGAALLGFSVLALSSVDIARASMVLGLGALGAAAKLVYAAIAAVIGALGGYVAAWLIKRLFARSRRSGPVAAIAAQRVRPIDPALELGSESLDAPIENTPFSPSTALADAPVEAGDGEEWLDGVPLASLDEAISDEEANAPEDDAVFELGARDELSDPQETASEPEETSEEPETAEEAVNDDADAGLNDAGLNFEVFAAIMQDETQDFEARKQAAERAHLAERDESVSASQVPATMGATMGATTGIAKLRQTAPQDLSLMQLVERFAAALHEVQNADGSPLTTAEIGQANAERELALVQALKALEFFTAGSSASPVSGAASGAASASSSDSPLGETERDLRDALTRLQTLRGAA